MWHVFWTATTQMSCATVVRECILMYCHEFTVSVSFYFVLLSPSLKVYCVFWSSIWFPRFFLQWSPEAAPLLCQLSLLLLLRRINVLSLGRVLSLFSFPPISCSCVFVSPSFAPKTWFVPLTIAEVWFIWDFLAQAFIGLSCQVGQR